MLVLCAVGAEEPTPEIGNKDYTVIYDGDCQVCARTVRLLREWDGGRRMEFVPSQAPGVRERYSWIPDANFAESMQVIAADGRAFQGARGFEEILSALPQGRLVTWIFAIPLVRPIAERFYRWFARNRDKLGCSDHCALPPL